MRRTRVRGWWWAAACAAVVALTVLATVAPARAAEQHLIMNNDSEPQTLDPAKATGVLEDRIISELFEGLTRLHPQTLKPIPGVAERWTTSDDGLTYTFYLRENAKWSDGKPLTSADFIYAWLRALDPAFGAPYASQFYPIAGAEAYSTAPPEARLPASSLGFSAPDARTLVVTLHTPCPWFLELTSFYTLFPLPKAAVEAGGDSWTQPQFIVSNGPFRLESWKPRQEIVVVRNPHYWDRAKVKLDKVTFLPYEDLDTVYQLYQQGKLAWMPSVPPGKLDEVKRHPDYYVHDYMGSYFYRFNCTKPPFDDARVRRAFSMAVDRKEITDHIMKSGQLPAGWLCPTMPPYTHIDGISYNPVAAKALLAEAGYGPGGKPLPPIEILYNTHERHKQIAEYIGQQWKQILGAEVATQNSEWKVYLDRMQSLDFQVIRASWIGDYADPNTFFDLWIKDGGNNRTGWSSSVYEGWLKESQASRDPAVRNALFHKMETLLVVDEAAILPIYMYVSQGLLSEDVMGWYANVRDRHPLKEVWMEAAP